MGTRSLSQHISKQFDEELEDLRSRVMLMGGLVEDQLTKALEAMDGMDVELAEYVSTHDYQVNSMEVSIDEECTQVLARRQPAAGDLRLVLAVIKTISDLERIGDEVEKIGRMVVRMSEQESPKSYYISVLSMGKHVQQMLHASLDVFVRMDSQRAVDVAAEDERIDEEYGAIMRQLITYMIEDPRSISKVLDVVWAVRALERVGDHAKNICENVIYLVEGKDVRHTSIEDMQREISSD